MGSTAFEKATIEVRSPQPGVALVVLAGEHDLYSGDELRQILEASLACCDHLIVDLGDHPVAVGDEIAFGVGYGALVRAMTSPFVTKVEHPAAVEAVPEATPLPPSI